MLRDLLVCISILAVLLFIAGGEVIYLTGKFAALILVSGAITALLWSMQSRTEGVVLDNKYEGQDVIELEALGIKGKVKSKRLLSENSLLLILIFALAALGYKHHTSNEEQLQRIYEATTENTYVLSLSGAEREALRITMPESLKRKIRERAQ